MKIQFCFILGLITILESASFCQQQPWKRCKGKFADSPVSHFSVFDSTLIAGARDGVIYYNSETDSWDEIIKVGSVKDIIKYNNELYVLSGPPQINVISEDKKVTNIPLDIDKYDIQTLYSILIFKGRLYAGGGRGVFYKALEDTTWHKMGTNRIAAPVGVMQVIRYQDQLLAVGKNGIFISENGTEFTEQIKSDEILRADPDITFPIKRNMKNRYRIYAVLNDNNKGLYAYNDRQIFYTKDLLNWEKYDNEVFNELFNLFPICCNGLIATGMDLKYSFKKNNWIRLPKIDMDNSLVGNICIYNNKIFTGILNTDNKGIWYLDFNYSLKINNNY